MENIRQSLPQFSGKWKLSAFFGNKRSNTDPTRLARHVQNGHLFTSFIYFICHLKYLHIPDGRLWLRRRSRIMYCTERADVKSKEKLWICEVIIKANEFRRIMNWSLTGIITAKHKHLLLEYLTIFQWLVSSQSFSNHSDFNHQYLNYSLSYLGFFKNTHIILEIHNCVWNKL